ncbi:hypothetical protein P775_22245 [Puniceibacterium antarcticum]|uniref:Uncharacterized protein n=1 Tax=Puniceibacterium antarcticum TaxID=1206336 RepID=A0A2G8R8U2_9RHOB|nr:hypothetical protein P775_22245 [Puniceibacterium antarcticum]
MATLGWVDSGVVEETAEFKSRRLLGAIGNIPPAEAEDNLCAQRNLIKMVA